MHVCLFLSFFQTENLLHSVIEAQRETRKSLNNSKNNFFSLKITVLFDLTWSKMGVAIYCILLPQLGALEVKITHAYPQNSFIVTN